MSYCLATSPGYIKLDSHSTLKSVIFVWIHCRHFFCCPHLVIHCAILVQFWVNFWLVWLRVASMCLNRAGTKFYITLQIDKLAVQYMACLNIKWITFQFLSFLVLSTLHFLLETPTRRARLIVWLSFCEKCHFLLWTLSFIWINWPYWNYRSFVFTSKKSSGITMPTCIRMLPRATKRNPVHIWFMMQAVPLFNQVVYDSLMMLCD